jgi:hypothetical protein
MSSPSNNLCQFIRHGQSSDHCSVEAPDVVHESTVSELLQGFNVNSAHLQHLTLADLAFRCEQETNLFFKHESHDPKYCYELFRRAIQENDQSIWESIFACYESLVVGWVKKHSGFETSGESVDYFVNGAFAKFSVTMTPDKFGKFSDVGSLLSYLKMCVHSVMIDYHRMIEHANLYDLDDVSREASDDLPPEEQAIEQADRQALWDLINARLHDRKERAVVQGTFVLGLKPRELYHHFPGVFSAVDEIYSVKQNVLARLRRDPAFVERFVGEG